MMKPHRGVLEAFDDIAAISRKACDDLIPLCHAAIEANGVCRIALAGGSTPKLLYELMARHADAFQWDSIHLFWGDERNVLPNDPQSNFKMVCEALLDHVPIPAANVHRVPIDPAEPALTAEAYEKTLRSEFASDQTAWDLVLLGMGDDAHTASLFPQTDAIEQTERLFVENWVAKFDTFRLTLTAPAINTAKNVWFLIGGANKREALQNVWGAHHDPTRYPSQLIQPAGNLRWMLTRDAIPSAEL
ncbi:MAG: 6-phosphogluconolactonase [Pirellulaceae bacterium]